MSKISVKDPFYNLFNLWKIYIGVKKEVFEIYIFLIIENKVHYSVLRKYIKSYLFTMLIHFMFKLGFFFLRSLPWSNIDIMD